MELSEIINKSQITNPKSQINPKYQITKLQKTRRFRSLFIWLLIIVWNLVIGIWNLAYVYSQEIKHPNVAGSFYPENPQELSTMIDGFLNLANPKPKDAEIFALIVPHAGYVFSGQTSAFAYKLIKDKPYKTVIVIGPTHYYGFSGISVFPNGIFRTPLGDIEIDSEFTQKLLHKDNDILFRPDAFAREHSVEVQLPFLQKVLANFKIVPIVMGDCSFSVCQKLATLLKEAIGKRQDVLVVISTDMYHGYDYQEADKIDNLTCAYIQNMDAKGLYDGLRAGSLELCGGFGVVSALLLSNSLAHNKVTVLNQTNSAIVTGKKEKGSWTVGYISCIIDQEKREVKMLNKNQRKRLLEIARSSIEIYLKTNAKLELKETDPALLKEMGAFVTLHEHKELRGCIGNLIGEGPLYLTVRDMAVEAAVGDPRFVPLKLTELKEIEIEISALSPMERVDSADKIQMGTHGVLIRKGYRSGVYLPQVATETGWTKEEFLNSLCAHKAGLSPDAWKDKATEIYIFTAEVFSEGNY